ncbi:hypothetical protein [Caballeronia glebae]|uniref:hypothetical protein n=1 Tax=Caballeronia glebae TaxID=1777143 RepID=UPI0038B7F7D5
MTPTDLPKTTTNGALGAMHLLAEYDAQENQLRRVRLEASSDSRSVILVDTDLRRPGVQRETRHEITPAELIALIRARGAELPGENHARASI